MEDLPTTAQCPVDELLRSLLSTDRTHETLRPLEDHVATCRECIRRIEGMSPAVPATWRVALVRKQVAESQSVAIAAFATGDFTGLREPSFAANYAIANQIGRGGMGVVYLARQLSLNRDVAIKTLSTRKHVTLEAVERLKTEGERLAMLAHANIVHVYDAGIAAEMPYFVMEYVPGRSLADAIIGGAKYAPREAALLVRGVADAISAAHGVGVFHRDLKPGNVLLKDRTTPKVTDFGLATTREELDDSPTGQVAGTAAYMAPEQWIGDGTRIDERTDVYGLGAILYELIAGRPPFSGSGRLAELKKRVLFDLPPGPRSLRPGIPRDLEAIAMMALQKDPERRYATAAEMRDDLARFQNRRPVKARSAGPLHRLAYFCNRQRWMVLFVFIFLLGGAAAAVAIAIERSEARELELQKQRERDLHQREGAAREAFDAGERHIRAGQYDEALERFRYAADTMPDRWPEWQRYYTQHLAAWTADVPKFLGRVEHDAIIERAVLSPAGTHIAFADSRYRLYLWKLGDPSPVLLHASKEADRQSFAFDSKGANLIAGGYDSTLRQWSVDRPNAEPRSTRTTKWIGSVAFAGVQGDVLSGCHFKRLNRHEFCGEGQSLKLASRTELPGNIEHIDGHSAGHAVLRLPGVTLLCTKGSDSPLDLDKVCSKRVICHSFSAGGEAIVCGHEDGRLSRVDTATGQSIGAPSYRNQPGCIEALACSLDGSIALIAKGESGDEVRWSNADQTLWDALPVARDAALWSTVEHRFCILEGVGSFKITVRKLPERRHRVATLGFGVGLATLQASADGKKLAISAHGTIGKFGEEQTPAAKEASWEAIVWDLDRFERMAWKRGKSSFVPIEDRIEGLALFPDGQSLAARIETRNGSRMRLCAPIGVGLLNWAMSCNEDFAPIRIAAKDGTLGLLALSIADQKAGGVPSLSAWSPEAGQLVRKATLPLEEAAIQLAVSPDGRWIAVGTRSGRLHFISDRDWSTSQSIIDNPGFISSMRFSADGLHLIVATGDGLVRIYESGPMWRLKATIVLGAGQIVSVGYDSSTSIATISTLNRGLIRWNVAVERQVGRTVKFPSDVIVAIPTKSGVIALLETGHLVDYRDGR